MIRTTDLSVAEQVLRDGGVIAYPTETLPGLGCLATNEAAIRKILRIKKRPANKGLILLVSSTNQLEPWVNPLDDNMMLALQNSPEQPTTWLFPVTDQRHPLLQGEHSKQAIRITSHPTAISLCDRLDEAIVSTSINVGGEPAASNLSEIPASILEQLDLLLSGPEGTGKPSQIRDIQTNRVIR